MLAPHAFWFSKIIKTELDIFLWKMLWYTEICCRNGKTRNFGSKKVICYWFFNVIVKMSFFKKYGKRNLYYPITRRAWNSHRTCAMNECPPFGNSENCGICAEFGDAHQTWTHEWQSVKIFFSKKLRIPKTKFLILLDYLVGRKEV